MSRDTSAPLTFHLSRAAWHVERWKALGEPVISVNSNKVFALCCIVMAYALDRNAFTTTEREYFESNVAAYGHALGIYLDINMEPREVAAAHFNNLGAEHFDIMVSLGIDPADPIFWVRYSEAVRATKYDSIELHTDIYPMQ